MEGALNRGVVAVGGDGVVTWEAGRLRCAVVGEGS